MRCPSVVALLLFVRACSNTEVDETREACESAYARLDALGCEAMMKELIERGCFDSQFEEHCDLSVLDPCTNEIAAFDEPLDVFLDRKCGPAGTKTIEWPKFDPTAVAAAKAAKAEAEEAELVKQEAERAKLKELASRAAKAAEVEVGRLDLVGEVSMTSVLALVENDLDAVRECYGAALVHAPTISGTVKINFVIGADGNVPASVVQESTLKNPAVGTCMAKAIKRLQFPKPSSADPVMVTVPYTLSPGEYASE